MSDPTLAWHCRQIPNGEHPVVVCERDDLAHRIEVLSEALAEIADANGADGVFGRIANTALQGDTRG